MTEDYTKIFSSPSEAAMFIREHRATRPVKAGEPSFGEVGGYGQPVVIVSNRKPLDYGKLQAVTVAKGDTWESLKDYFGISE